MKWKKHKPIVVDRNVKIVEDGIICCYFDGSCEPVNPGGSMGFGAIIKFDGKVMAEYSFKVPAHPDNTNNIAEYCSLKWILETLLSRGMNHLPIIIYGDSSLVIHQMRGLWKIKNGFYKQHALRCLQLVLQFTQLTLVWIPREMNQHADNLSKFITDDSQK